MSARTRTQDEAQEFLGKAIRADKVVLGAWWFCHVDGQLVTGPVYGSTLQVIEAELVVDMREDGQTPDFEQLAQRAEAMLTIEAHRIALRGVVASMKAWGSTHPSHWAEAERVLGETVPARELEG